MVDDSKISLLYVDGYYNVMVIKCNFSIESFNDGVWIMKPMISLGKEESQICGW